MTGVSFPARCPDIRFANPMDRRQNARVAAYLPVRIWGVDAKACPFIHLARVKNISAGGAVLQGMHQLIRPGEIVDVQCGGLKAQFRVMWVGKRGTELGGEVGLESLPSEPDIWGIALNRCMTASCELVP